MRAPRNTTLTLREGEVLLQVAKDSILIPESLLIAKQDGKYLFEGKEYLWEDISALITPARCYAALHGDFGEAYELVCIERPSAKILWKIDGWGSASTGNASGGGYTGWVAVTEQDDRVVVFGFSNYDVYVEAFRSADGANLFRFSSSYACVRKGME